MSPLLIPLLGAGAGALLSKKDPLKGALMGGALGFGGAALAPGLLGAGAAGTAAGTAATGTAATGASGGSALLPGYFASEAAMPLATQAAGSTGAAAGAQAATPGLFESASAYAKQADPIMKAAVMGKTLAGTGQQPQASPLMPNNGQGGNTLNALMQQGNQYQNTLQQAQMARMQRRSQW